MTLRTSKTARSTGRRRRATRDPFAPFRVTKAAQVVTKSDQLFQDVQFLYRKDRFSLVLYLGGFVIECLLKAALWDRRHESRIRGLLFGHDLAELLAACPVLSKEMERDRHGTYNNFVRVCNWHVGIRYNPKRPAKEDARAFLTQLREVRQWLRRKV